MKISHILTVPCKKHLKCFSKGFKKMSTFSKVYEEENDFDKHVKGNQKRKLLYSYLFLYISTFIFYTFIYLSVYQFLFSYNVIF